MIPTHARLLFRVPVTHLTEEEYDSRWRDERKRRFELWGERVPELGDPPSNAEILYWAEHPPTYPYNDLYGFIEVYWDGGTRIQAESYFLGDARRTAGRHLRHLHQGLRLRSGKYYPYHHRQDLAWLPRGFTEAQARQAVHAALSETRRLAQQVRGVVHLEQYERMIAFVRWHKVLSHE